MSNYRIKTTGKLILDGSEVDFISSLIKLNTSPAVNNANLQYLTRNTGTGNLEIVNNLPTLYNANGSLTGNRTVSAGISNNLTFTGGFGTFTVSSWQNVVLNGEIITSTSSTSSTFNSVNVLNLGTTTPTTTISDVARTLNINSSTTKLTNVTFKPAGLLSGQYLFVDSVTKNIRCENLPNAYAASELVSLGGGPTLTSVTPIDVSGPNVGINPGLSYNFTTTAGSGLQYVITSNSTTFPVTVFRIEISGFFSASVAQEYTVGILINGVLYNKSACDFTYSGATSLPISIKPVIVALSNGDEIRIALGRKTSNATMNFSVSFNILPVAYY